MQRGLNPRTDWDIDWDELLANGEPVAVAFEPFDGLWTVYCDCCAVHGEYAILDIPASSDVEQSFKAPSNWLPCDERHWAIVPEIFLRLQ